MDSRVVAISGKLRSPASRSRRRARWCAANASRCLLTILLGVAAGLAVFLFAVSQLSEGLHEIAGDSMRHVLSSVTRNVFLAILCGIVATAALGSSSAAIVIL